MATFDGSDYLEAEQTPAFDKMNTEYRIYVDNLPQELKEDAIRQVFSPYGKITGMFYCPNATWTYITYGSYREAELAIRELNNKKPLYLKVALARERAVNGEFEHSDIKIEEKAYIQHTKPVLIQNVKQNTSQGVGRGYAIRKRIAVPDMIVPHHENLQSFPSSMISSPYEIDDPYMSTNKLWTRGLLTVTADGKRHVSLGRGYSMYEIPEPDPRCEDYITQVYELRKNGLYEYADDKFKKDLQRCIVCTAQTTKHCEKCYTYYCGKACQVTHWPRHQIECERIPDLVDETPPLEQVKNVTEQPSSNNTQVPVNTFSDVKLRRPNTPAKVLNLNTNVQRTNQTNENAKTTDKCHNNQLDNKNNSSKEKIISQPAVNATASNKIPQNFNRYNASENIDQTKKNDQFSTTANHTRQNYTHGYKNDSTNKTCPDKEINKSDNIRDKFNNVSRSYSHQKGKFQNNRNGSQNDRKASCNQRETTTTINKQEQKLSVSIVATDEGLDFRKDTYLSKTNFKDVEIIVPLDNNEYWVYKVEDTNARNDLTTKLQDVAKNSHNVQPVIGDVYGVLYKTIWHRAMIVSLNPLRVHFIDSGKDEILEKNTEIRDIQNLTNVPRFARKIRVEDMNAKNLLHGDKISVKMLSMDAEKTMAVEIKELSDNVATCAIKDSPRLSNPNNSTVKAPQEISSPNTRETPATQLCNILDSFADLLTENAVPELTISGIIQIFECMQKNIYTATLIPDDFTNNMDKIINYLPEVCKKMTEATSNYKPKVGDLVCGEIENGVWYRGYVTSSLPDLRVAVVDEARISPAIRALPCPKEFLNICTYGVTCEVINAKMQADEVYNFIGVVKKHDIKQGSFKIKIKKDDEFIEATIKPWQHIIKSIPALAELKNGSKICLINYRNQYIMFANSLDKSEVEYTNDINQRVAHCSQKAPHLSKPPSIGQMVIAPYMDGNKYRAMVTKLQDNTATIVYVDFGNFTDINVNELQEISDDLAVKRSCSGRLVLKDVPHDVPMSAEVDAYLRDLVGREESLVCTYDNGSFKNGVYLTTDTGESVNDKIKELLIPSWKKDNYDDKTCYMINDISIAPMGKVGDTVEALVLHLSDIKNLSFMMSPFDLDLITHVINDMSGLIQEYCEKTEYYIPRKQELCLALYDGTWYRALCLDPHGSSTECEIFFIDYGNVDIVEHKNVRQMPETFIRPAAMANICSVINLAPVDSAGNYSTAVQQKVSELVTINSPVQIKIVEFLDSGEYKVELPKIRATLEQAGLVPSSF
ncbi:uncharacterized protein LOC116843316 isoform X1 [Odontomachus brunneus]|uniref:uncharacterized protein LOC116843316 isoform X1 n=1 Tax=Odontomachus brunneus TaxID=486640 RepID=UPI0013F1C8C6|nr:uncharacterized protein LOC116843316 isoform X1 [Odontomachus brunneus]